MELESYQVAVLQEIHRSLDKSLQSSQSKINPFITEMLKLGQNQFSQYSVFEVGEIQKNASLKAEDMQKAIDLLSKHFKEFTKLLEQETTKYVEKMEVLFAGTDGEILQKEITKLLGELSWKVDKEFCLQRLQELFDSVKEKLRSKKWSSEERKKKNKEREEKLSNLLKIQEEIICLGNTTERKKEFDFLEKELDELCEIQKELTKLQMKKNNLQERQEPNNPQSASE